MALTPFAIKNMDKTKVDDNKRVRGLDWMSSKTLFKNPCASEGATDKKNEEKVSSIFSKGTNGIKLRTKIRNGNNAIKKLKAILLARVVRAPFNTPNT